MTQVLARKWRPRNFAELVGQEHVVRALTNALREKRLHHAYLFTGTRGVGKTTLARIIAKALNCDTGVTDAPCGKCRPCTEIDAGRFVDLIELDAASNTQVDNMRELLENAMYAPTAARFKVYIIDEVHMLSKNAFNAMLKTLEEPPEHVKFVLATTDPQKIPVTVLSRCLQFNLKQIPPPQIEKQLAKVLDAEKITFEPAALTLLARAAQGSLRDALSLLDQGIAHSAGKVELQSTRAMLGAVDQTYLYSILRALSAGDGRELIAEADRMNERSLSFEMALQDLGTLLHRLALVQVVPDAVSAEDPDAEALHALAKAFRAEDLQLYYQIVVQARTDIGCAPDEYAGFTMALLRMRAFAPGAAGDAPAKSAPPATAPAVRSTRTAAAARAESSRSEPSSVPTPLSTRDEPSPSSARLEPASSSARPDPTPSSARPVPGPSAVRPERTAVESKDERRPAPATASGESWVDILEKLGLTGMARMLAQHCEVTTHDEKRIALTLPRAHERLLEKAYEERLKGALKKLFGETVHVTIVVGEGTGSSPVAVAERERQKAQARAIAQIEQDPFVRDLVENFDARVNEASIKPLQQEGDA